MDHDRRHRENAVDAAEGTAKAATHEAERAARSPVARGFARTGFVFAGVLHVLIAWLAFRVALGGSRASADQSGAFEQLAAAPGGPALLWAGAACCTALAVWMVIEAGGRWHRHSRFTKALGPAGTGLAYFCIAALFASFALGNRSNSSQESREITARLLEVPLGAVVLVAAGLALLAAGAYFGFRGVTRSFLDQETQPGDSAPAWVKATGCVGYVAKGVALAVVGVLVLVATARHDPSQQSGLDGALKGLAAQPFGGWILGAVALGLASYGVYSAARAKYADF